MAKTEEQHMSLIIEMPPELETRLLEEAEKVGMTPSEFVTQIIIERLDRVCVTRTAHI